MQIEYAGLRLGMTMKETKYIKGMPQAVYKKVLEGEMTGFAKVIPIDQLEKGQTVEDFYRWSYEISNGAEIDVVFNRQKKLLIFRSWVSNLRLQTETGLSRSFILFSPKKGAHP